MIERDDFPRGRQDATPRPGYPPPPPGWAPPPGYPPPRGAQYPPPGPRQAPPFPPQPNRQAPPKPRPAGGWRATIHRATFGLVNPGPSPAQRREAELIAVIRAPFPRHLKIGVLGKGGVGKTSVSASVGSIFAEQRPADRVVALDADTAFGRLASRIDPSVHGSYWELASDKNLQSFADLRGRVGNNATGLYVLAGEPPTTRRRVLDPAVYREAALRLDRHFTISIVDCGSTMDAPVTQEALRDVDALIVVSSPWADGAAAAAQTMAWLANHGKTELLRRTVVVLNDSDGHSDKRTRATLAHQFTSRGQTVVEVPFDPHLRPGGVIDVTREMAPTTKLRFLEIAAAISHNFAQSGVSARTFR